MKQVLSPYIQQLPIEFLRNSELGASLHLDYDSTYLLCDLLGQKVYILDSRLISKLQNHSIMRRNKQQECGLYVSEEEVYTNHNYIGLEIEVNTHCNYKCIFCPVSQTIQTKAFMKPETYDLVLQKALEYGIREISLNHYSEPTLALDIGDKICLAATMGFNVTLFTNASNLVPDLIDRISGFDTLQIVVNFPESNRKDYKKTTGRDMFNRVVSNINYTLQKKPVSIWVNNPNSNTVREIEAIFPLADVKYWRTDDRVGEIEIPQYATPIYHHGLLNGCPLSIRYLNVGVEGEVFLCSQDFHKKNILGNLHQKSIAEIVTGHENRKIRKWLFGKEESPHDFICRRCCWTKTQEDEFSVGADLNGYDLDIYKKFIAQDNIVFMYLKNEKVHLRQL